MAKHRPRAAARGIRVSVVDDHRFVADLLLAAFERHAERFVFWGSASRLSELPALLRQEPADVVLVDYALPDGTGSDALRLLKRHWPRARSVLFSGHDQPEIVREAIAAGAEGVLTKARGIADVLEVIERAHRGDVLLDGELLWELMLQPGGPQLRLLARARLTPRERTALETLLAVGRTDLAARQLGVRPATLRVHLHRASAKLGAESRLEAISLALRGGLIRAPKAAGSRAARPRATGADAKRRA